MKKTLALIVTAILIMSNLQFTAIAEKLPFQQPFHSILGIEDINEIKYGVIVNDTDKRCAEIDYEDLSAWLNVYWNFSYDLVIAPIEAFDNSGYYVKLYNSDKSLSYTVCSNSGIILGEYGLSTDRKNYVWYLPVAGNSRNALATADITLQHIYFNKTYEGYKNSETKFNTAFEKDIPTVNLLNTDSASSWAAPQIQKAAAYNLMVYDLSDKYTSPISRYDFCRLIYRLIATDYNPNTDSRIGIDFAISDIISKKGITDSNINKFKDCYYIETEALASMGIINGVGNDLFDPDGLLTREQSAVILYRTAEFLEKEMPTAFLQDKYSDFNDISSWATDAVLCMRFMDIMHGDGNGCFNPKKAYTTEQAIATILRLYLKNTAF